MKLPTTRPQKRDLPLHNANRLPVTQLVDWVAVEELNLSSYIGETILIAVYTHYASSLTATQ